jgi:hypothetical protein
LTPLVGPPPPNIVLHSFVGSFEEEGKWGDPKGVFLPIPSTGDSVHPNVEVVPLDLLGKLPQVPGVSRDTLAAQACRGDRP